MQNLKSHRNTQRITKNVTLALAVLVVGGAYSQNIEIRNVRCQAQGCQGAQVLSSPDNSIVSVLYSGFRVALGEGPGRRPRDQINSILSFNVLVPSGYQLELINMDIRGFAFLSPSAGGSLSFKQIGKRKRGNFPDVNPVRNFAENTIGEFYQTVALGAPFKSECGDELDFKLITNLSVFDRSRPGSRSPIQPSEISMDTADLSSPALVYKVRLKRCE